jgi:hypothetical protein
MIDHAGVSMDFNAETGGQENESVPDPFLPVVEVFFRIRIGSKQE